MAPSEQLEYQAGAIHTLMEHTSPDQFGNPTPCAEWDVHALLNHLVGGGHMFGALYKGEAPSFDPEAPMPDLVGTDPAAAWDEAVAAFREGIDSPGALERELPLGPAQVPGGVILEILKMDLLVHAWDLAQATGQSFDPPAEVVDPIAAAARNLIAEGMRDGSTFAAEVTPPADATPIARLAAFTGRAV